MAFAEPEQEINRILGQGPIREYHLEGPVEVSVSFYRAGTELFFSGMLKTRTGAVCARCAEDFDAAGDRPFRFVLSPKSIGYDDDHLRAEDLEFSLYEGDEVDLSPLIREQVLLALPTRPLCQEDCRGLVSALRHQSQSRRVRLPRGNGRSTARSSKVAKAAAHLIGSTFNIRK